MTRKTKLHEIRDYVIIALAMIEGSIGLNIFLLPNHITMGGVGGIASILCWGFGIPASVSYLALNVFLLLIAFRILGYKFRRPQWFRRPVWYRQWWYRLQRSR
jgi:uncharacterized membrane-anchored protein YitT (DUF2179 family)